MKRHSILLFIFLVYFFSNTFSQKLAGPNVLVVIAHPDDESGCAATIYKITHELGGKADVCVITNGEGGYKYSTLAESYYGLELTDEKVGRENLPGIRKKELMNAGKIIGVRNIFFLDQKDDKYGLDEKDPLDTIWDTTLVKHRLQQIMTTTHYDFIFCLLPYPQTHAHHKAATILALRTVSEMPSEKRPIILGVGFSSKSDTIKTKFSQLEGYKETKILISTPVFVLDRTVKFGYKDRLNYQIVVNWEIAEHKSQGTMQMNAEDYENFQIFDINGPGAIEKTQTLFDRLKFIPYPQKTY